MNKTFASLLLAFPLAFCINKSQAQDKETFKRDGLTLNFTSLDSTFDPALKKRMVETFFKVYPQLKKEFNPKAATEINFVIDTAYKGVAATGGGRIVYSPDYMRAHPGDIDVVTHEVMHVIQSYGGGEVPGWLTEGIADYVRYKFGVDNAGANWSLPEFKSSQSYTNSYRITARFLAWLEKGNKGIVKKLDASMRAGTYRTAIWSTETGKSLDELWKAYSENPVI